MVAREQLWWRHGTGHQLPEIGHAVGMVLVALIHAVYWEGSELKMKSGKEVEERAIIKLYDTSNWEKGVEPR